LIIVIALKAQNKIAQGNALGKRTKKQFLALKGQNKNYPAPSGQINKICR